MSTTINSNETYTILGKSLQDICDSVSEKTGSDDIPVQKLPKLISGIGGLAYEDIKDVMFMDYNGDVLYSYDADDFINNVTALPAGPDWHDGLTFQEWNWDLADIKDELQNGSGACCIGAHYTTTDGATHLFIDLKESIGEKAIRIYLYRVSGTITIDWGDGSSQNIATTSNLQHTYSNYGEYEIKISNGSLLLSNNIWFCRYDVPSADLSGVYYARSNHFLKEVWFGTNYAFQP